MHAKTTCLPALLANSADHTPLLLHVLMVLCPSLLLIVTKYADLGQVQIRTQRSRELPSNLVAAL